MDNPKKKPGAGIPAKPGTVAKPAARPGAQVVSARKTVAPVAVKKVVAPEPVESDAPVAETEDAIRPEIDSGNDSSMLAEPDTERTHDGGSSPESGKFSKSESKTMEVLPTWDPTRNTMAIKRSAMDGASRETALRRPSYMPYGDTARVLGTIAVVFGHCCDMVQFSGNASETEWWACNVVNSFCRWAVPIYIMLSGALLLDPAKKEDYSTFYGKRLARLGVPVIFWSTFFILFEIYYLKGWGNSWDKSLNNLMLGKPYAHLHFIFRIMGLYAFTPMLRVFLAHADRKLVAVTAGIMLALGSLNSILDGITGNEQSAFLRFAPFMGFFLTGYLLRDFRLSKSGLKACWFLAIGCMLLLAGGTGFLCQTFGFKGYPSISMELYDFLSPVRIAMALCVWLIFVNTFREDWMKSKIGKAIAWVAPLTLGMYLIHPLFRELLFYTHYDPITKITTGLGITVATPFGMNGLQNIWSGIPLVSLMVYLPSLLAIWLIMKIPVVRRIAV